MSRPTADCIRNSFRSSGKRHLILTGSRGSGKTTRLDQLFPKTLPGAVSWVEPKKAVYLRDNITGEVRQVGVFDPELPGGENRMQPRSEVFAGWGAELLRRWGGTDSAWARIDEIGYLECTCPEYRAGLLELMEKKRLAAVVRKQPIPFLTALCTREDAFTVDLDAPYGHLGCVIMASGLGRRFGGNKLLAPFRGKPLMEWVLDATEGIFERRVVVTRHEAVAALCRQRSIPTVLHSLPRRADTVRLGLEALGDLDGCLFCPGDQPLLRPETLQAMALCAANDPQTIWRAGWNGGGGAPVLFPRWTFPELRTLPPDRGGGFVIQKYPHRTALVTVGDPMEMRDIDTPEDLAALEAMAQSCRTSTADSATAECVPGP